jgi:hypothetical protein
MRLTEQAKLLKEEIRRMERNQKREEETSNMEYLKNILLKVSVCSVCNIYADFYISTIIVFINIVYYVVRRRRPSKAYRPSDHES